MLCSSGWCQLSRRRPGRAGRQRRIARADAPAAAQRQERRPGNVSVPFLTPASHTGFRGRLSLRVGHPTLAVICSGPGVKQVLDSDLALWAWHAGCTDGKPAALVLFRQSILSYSHFPACLTPLFLHGDPTAVTPTFTAQAMRGPDLAVHWSSTLHKDL